VRHIHRNEVGQSLVIVLSLITLLFLLGSSLAVHASVALRTTRTSAGQGDEFYAADAATELGVWWQRNGKAGNPPVQTINGITTSTTITSTPGAGGTCPADAKPLWLSGFESGKLSQNNGGFYIVSGASSGVLDTVSSPVHTGSYSMRIHPMVNGSHYAQVQAPASPVLGPTFVLHFALRFDVLPTLDAVMLEIRSGCGPCGTYPQMFLFYRPSTGKWAVSMGSSLTGLYQKYQEANVGPVAGQWDTFDIRWNAGASPPTPRAIEWSIDDSSQTTLSFLDGSATWAGGGPAFGQDDIYTNAQYTAYYDDVMVSSTSADYPLGDIKITALKPNGMGTNSPATPNAFFKNDDGTDVNATSWQRVDELPITGTTDFIKQISKSTGGEYVELAFADTTETCVRGASLVSSLRAVSGAPTAAVNSVTNGFNYTIWSGALSTTQSYAQGVLSQNSLNPGTGPWTQAIINGVTARFGMSGNASGSKVDALDSIILELAYRSVVASPATITIAGSAGGSTVNTSYSDAGAAAPTLSTWTTTK